MISDNEFLANYAYWLKVKVWTGREAASLMLGFEPDSIWFSSEKSDILKEGRKDAKKLYRILSRAADLGEFGPVRYGLEGETIAPPVVWQDWVQFANDNDLICAKSFVEAVAAHSPSANTVDELHPRSEATYQRIIGGLIQLLTGETSGKANSIFRNQEAVVQALVFNYGDRDGISERTLDEKFAKAKARLRQD